MPACAKKNAVSLAPSVTPRASFRANHLQSDPTLETLTMTIDIQEWEGKLVGKKIIPSGGQVTNPENEFAEDAIKDGVPAYRILRSDSMMTMDYREDRINVYVDDDNNVVERVTIG